MTVSEATTNELRHAYRVLDVPWNASPQTIRTSYRRLIKRWHPDRYLPGGDSYRDSTLMTRLLNDAYGRIKDAPLRHGGTEGLFSEQSNPSGENEPSGSSRNEYVSRDASQDAAEYYKILERARQAGAADDASRPFDWLGFVVRFFFGALFGAVLSFKVIFYFYRNPRLMDVAIALTILLCAFASGFAGDAFWRSIRPGWRWWW